MNENEFLTSEIKQRKIIFYLVSSDDIDSIKSNSRFSDFFLAASSMALGAYISIYASQILSNTNTNTNTLSSLSVLKNCLLIGGLIFIILYLIFAIKSFNKIKLLKNSGSVDSFYKEQVPVTGKTNNKDEQSLLKIIFAHYYSSNDASKNYDLTDILSNEIINNKIDIKLTNDIGSINYDPDWGKAKKMVLKYSYDGVVYQKQYNEGDMIILP